MVERLAVGLTRRQGIREAVLGGVYGGAAVSVGWWTGVVRLRAPGNMEFVEDETNPYAQLELIEPVRAGEQLFVDYGPSYAYDEHGFAR